MSNICPLCGNSRLENALFCEDCSKKIQSDYEVYIPEIEVPETSDTSNTPISSDEPASHDSPVTPPTQASHDSPVTPDTPNASYTPVTPVTSVKDYNVNYKENKPTKRGNKLLRNIIIAAVLLSLFNIYNLTIRKSNLERSGWDKAVKLNSVDGYLDYIESNPTGVHFEDARIALMNLKQNEAITWEAIKSTNNVTELRNFMNQYSRSPYIPLAKSRLDSLSWMSALKSNRVDSYTEYLLLAESGEINGDYIAEAEKRYKMLFQSYPIDIATLDSLRTIVVGFYTSLSTIDHSGMFNFLAPYVNRFFDSGGSRREKITGQLLVTAAQIEGEGIKFSPDYEGVQYEKTIDDIYVVNVPLTKSYIEKGLEVQVPGYIAHIRINQFFQITSIYETKPFSEAP